MTIAAREPAPAEQGRTLAPLGRRLARVVETQTLGPYRLIAVADRDGPGDPRPGQFYMLAASDGWGGGAGERPYLPRAFSFCRVRSADDGAAVHPTLEFLLEAIGPGTERLAGLSAGDGLWIAGPLGVGFSRDGDRRPLLVGGGIGAAPLLGWQDELGARAEALLGFRSAAHARAGELFNAPVICTDDGSVGRAGVVTEGLRAELERDRGAVVYACGPAPMLEAVRALCAAKDVPAQLALEAGMACGFGACFGCVVSTRSGYLRLCVEGPVLDAAILDRVDAFGAVH